MDSTDKAEKAEESYDDFHEVYAVEALQWKTFLLVKGPALMHSFAPNQKHPLSFRGARQT